MIIFETPRLLVRRLVREDFDNFYFFNSDADVMRYIRPPQTREQAGFFLDENIAFYNSHPEYGRWALVEKASLSFIGSFMIKPSTLLAPLIETGYAFGKQYWGLGYASEVLTGGLHYAFKECRLPELVALTHPDNSASQKVLLKCGFTQLENIYDKEEPVCRFTIKNPGHD